MKKAFLAAAFLVLFSYAEAQGFIVNLNTGYCFGSSFESHNDDSNYYRAVLKEGWKYGLDMGYMVDRNFSVNLSFQYQKPDMAAVIEANGTDFTQTLPVNLLWIQAGGTSYLPIKRSSLFFGTYLGVGIYNFPDVAILNKEVLTRFAWSVRAGYGYFITKRVGINTRFDALFTVDPLTHQFATPGLEEGKTGSNSIFQFSIGAGITVLLFRPEGKK